MATQLCGEGKKNRKGCATREAIISGFVTRCAGCALARSTPSLRSVSQGRLFGGEELEFLLFPFAALRAGRPVSKAGTLARQNRRCRRVLAFTVTAAARVVS